VEAPNEEGRQALGKIEDDWAKALEAHDTTFFLRVLAPDFRATGDSGKMFGRAEVVHDAADTTFHVRDLHDQDRQIRIYGNGSVGVVSGLGTWTVEGGPRPGQHRGRYTEVYVKQGEGQWQGVAGHYTVVTP
jgi:ketosteroid isomerase-like protein